VSASSGRLARWSAGFAGAIGLAILSGWAFGVASLRNGLDSEVAVNPVGTIILVLAVVSIWISSLEGASSAARRVGLACGAAVLAIALIRIAVPIAGMSPWAIELVSGTRWGKGLGTAAPRPLSGGTALLYAMLGASLLLVTARRDGWRMLGRSIGLFLALIGILALFVALARLADGAADGTASGMVSLLAFLAMAIGLVATGPAKASHGLDDPGAIALRRRVNLAIAVAISILFLTGGVTIWSTSRSRSADLEREASWQRRIQLSFLLRSLQDASLGETELLLADTVPSLERYRVALDSLPALLRRATELSDPSAPQRRWLDSLRPEAEKAIGLHRDVFRLEQEGRRSEAIAIVGSGRARAARDDVRQRIERIIAAEDSLGARLEAVVRRDTGISIGTGLLAALLAVSFLLLAGVAINTDLRKRAEAELALRQSEAQLAQIVDLIPAMVFLKEPKEHRFVRLNRAGEDLLECSRDTMLGKTVFELFPKEIAEAYMAEDQAVLASSEVLDIPEEIVHTTNKGTRLLHTKKVAVRDQGGAPLFLLGISEDITDQKRADLALRDAKDSAEKANRAKSDFLAKMSHELRTPLNSIIGFSEILEDESAGVLNEKQRRYVGNVLLSGRNLLQLINDILDLAKVEAGRMELAISEFEPKAALEQVRSIVAALADKRRLTVHLSVPDDLPPLLADQPKFKQIMYNLLGNAIKFTGEGGRVDVSARILRASGNGSGTHALEVSVEDTGIGISAADQQRIFGEFEQVASDRARSQEGTGLGLALTRKLVELHGGRVWVESEVGRGSVFRFTIPYPGRRGLEAAPARAAGEASVGAEGPLILIIDNDPGARDLIAVLLQESGYRTASAETGADALRLAQSLTPDAITLDMLLPDRDGLLILAQLKSNPVTRSIPVVVVSVTDRRELGFSLGAADWLVKPIHRAALVAALERMVPQPGAAGRPTILIVDDEVPTLEYLSELIRGQGFEVTCASGGRAGVDIALDSQPDLILLDLMMPDLNGFDVVSTLRAHPRGEHIPILILTAKDLTAEDAERLRSSVQAVVRKGGKERLLAELARICPAAALAGAPHPKGRS
jgi:PAS domain S-box-containing protein